MKKPFVNNQLSLSEFAHLPTELKLKSIKSIKSNDHILAVFPLHEINELFEVLKQDETFLLDCINKNDLFVSSEREAVLKNWSRWFSEPLKSDMVTPFDISNKLLTLLDQLSLVLAELNLRHNGRSNKVQSGDKKYLN